MTISVLMPVYNAAPHLPEAIEALTAASDADIELVVLDDGSTDNSRSIIEAYAARDPRIRVYARENKGIAATRNDLLAAARGDYIAWADADDIRPVGAILEQADFLDSHPDVIAVCGGFSMISMAGDELSRLNSGKASRDVTDDLLQGKGVTHMCTYVVRASACRDLAFRTWFPSAEDIDFQFRLAERGRIYFLSGSFYRYRLSEDSITHALPTNRREFYHRAAATFAAQRRERGTDDLEDGAPPEPPSESDTAQSRRQHEAKILVGRAWMSLARGARLQALKSMSGAVARSPSDLSLWRQLAVMLMRVTAGRSVANQ